MKPVASGGKHSALTRSLFVTGLVLASIFVVYLQIRWMNQQKPKFQDSSYAQFTRIIDRQTLRVLCDHCDGAGVVRDPADTEQMALCPVCSGLGVHHVRFLDDRDVMCPTCRGLGRVGGEQWDAADVCPRCDGQGLVRADWDKLKIPVQKVICDACDGRGVLRNEENPVQLDRCGVCFGLGSHVVRRLDGYDEYCPACAGMGRLVDEESGLPRWCKLCEGRGLVYAKPVPPSEENRPR